MYTNERGEMRGRDEGGERTLKIANLMFTFYISDYLMFCLYLLWTTVESKMINYVYISFYYSSNILHVIISSIFSGFPNCPTEPVFVSPSQY